MLPPFILFMMAVATSSANDNVLSEHELKTLIRSSVDELCPLDNVCHNEATDPIDFRQEERPCCTSCSCRDDCHLTGDCCFTNRTMLDDKVLQNCRIPATKLDGFYFDSYYRHYLFIEECPSSAELINHRIEDTEVHRSCGEHAVAPWGSFHPVYSKVSRLLYKNSKCAECHGVKDGLLWLSELRCSSSDITMSDVFKRATMDGDCNVIFRYPGDGNDLEHLQCFTSIVKTCSADSNFPSIGNLAREDIIRLCESEFYAPVINVAIVYANAYCVLCQSLLTNEAFCSVDLFGARRPEDTLISLLSREFALSTENDSDNLKATPVACFKDDGNNCRRLFCPNGQFRLKNGDCKQITESWDVEYVTFVVKIAPGMHVNLAKVDSFFEQQLDQNTIDYTDYFNRSNTPWNTFVITGNGGFLQMPLSTSCEVERIYIDTAARDPAALQNSHFVAKLRMRHNITNPAHILKSLSIWLDKTWVIQVENTTSSAYQTLYPYAFPFDSIQGSPFEFPSYARFDDYNARNGTDVYTPELQLVYEQDTLDEKTKVWYINNKLSFCNHVRLISDEYTLFIEGNLLFLKEQSRVLYNSEFLILNENGHTYVHACVDDMDMAISGCCEIRMFSRYTRDLMFIYVLYSVAVLIFMDT